MTVRTYNNNTVLGFHICSHASQLIAHMNKFLLCNLPSSHSLISRQTNFALFWMNHSQAISEDLHKRSAYESVKLTNSDTIKGIINI